MTRLFCCPSAMMRLTASLCAETVNWKSSVAPSRSKLRTEMEEKFILYFVCLVLFDEVHKLFTCLGLIEGTGEVAGRGDGVLLLHTAHLHAHVLGFDDYHDTQRVEGLLDALLDL